MSSDTSRSPSHSAVAVVGAGPAGLAAAEVLAQAGLRVDVFDTMPSAGRKLLLAGKGGLNLTHSEPLQAFIDRYGAARDALAPMLKRFGPDELRAWAQQLGVRTFVGSSGRVFPVDLKAAPLLRAWLHRLRASGVVFHMRHRWAGFEAGPGEGAAHRLRFRTPQGDRVVGADTVVLALGGASWSRLGSDGAWVTPLAECGVAIAPLRPSNCGFEVGAGERADATPRGWSEHFRSRFAGHPMKTVALSMLGADGVLFHRKGEFVITGLGIEGSLVYALSALARDAIALSGRAVVHVDLLPQRSADVVRSEVARPRGSRSLSTHLKSRLGLDGVKAALLHEVLPREVIDDPLRLAEAIKHLPLSLVAARPNDEAISTAGGIRFDALDGQLMLRSLRGVFCAGEMLDWEAPTGGYLLTACFSSGMVAGEGARDYAQSRSLV